MIKYFLQNVQNAFREKEYHDKRQDLNLQAAHRAVERIEKERNEQIKTQKSLQLC